MRILQIASGDFFSTYGGGQVYVKNIVDTMIEMKLDVVVVSVVRSDTGLCEKSYNSIPIVDINSASHLEEAILRLKPDVIHAHSLKSQACLIGRKHGIPVVVTSHHGGIICPAGTRLDCDDRICHRQINHKDCLPCVLRNTRTGLSLWYPFMRFLSQPSYIKLGQWLSKKPFIPFITPVGVAANSIEWNKRQWQDIAEGCNLMIAPCKEIAETMIHNGINKEKIRIVPHGISLPDKRPDYPEIIDGKIKFYYVGRICYVKGIHTLLEAFHSVDNPQIELHLIGGAGNKHERRYMSRLQNQYRGDKRIVWHGKISPETVFEATRNYHVSSSAFLEAFGLNIAESLALGKPVLATRSGGAEMQIEDGVNGWLVPTNDHKSMAQKIIEITKNPEVLKNMSKQCHAIDIQTHCRTLNSIYNSLLQ